MRDRRVGTANRMADPLGAGLYVFSNVRWKTFDDPRERSSLYNSLMDISRVCPNFQMAVDFETLLLLQRRISTEWGRRSGSNSRCPLSSQALGDSLVSREALRPTAEDCDGESSEEAARPEDDLWRQVEPLAANPLGPARCSSLDCGLPAFDLSSDLDDGPGPEWHAAEWAPAL